MSPSIPVGLDGRAYEMVVGPALTHAVVRSIRTKAEIVAKGMDPEPPGAFLLSEGALP